MLEQSKLRPEIPRSSVGQSLALLFQKTSTRTRVSFEVAMTQLGGHALFVDWAASNFVLTELDYEIEYLSRNVEGIMARLLSQDDIATMCGVSQVPVINGCCDQFHPCQGLTDVLTMTEHSSKDLSDIHLVYTGVQNNVSNSLATLADKLSFRLSLSNAAANRYAPSLNTNPGIDCKEPSGRMGV